MIKVNETYARNYDIEILKELPSCDSSPRFYFPGATSFGGNDGVLVRVTVPNQENISWIGIFSFGRLSPRGATGIFTCPDPDWLCVIARGAGYFLNTKDPRGSEGLRAEPVLDAYAVPGANVLVFADYLHLVAYGSTGLVWESQRLSWDGLQVEKVTDHYIKGKVWSPVENRHVDFIVDLKNGKHQGGARVPSSL